MNSIQGPEDLEAVALKWELGNNDIYDADGDGVEDNLSDGWASWMFDMFYEPRVFHTVEDINNTKHGNLPGMRQKEWDKTQTEPRNTYDIIDNPDWIRW